MRPYRTLVLVSAYNAESTLAPVLERVPLARLGDGLEVLVIDDCSDDKTFDLGFEYRRTNCELPLTILRTPTSQGYGGNQKLGFQYAIEKRFDFVALLHGDGRYPPEFLPELLRPLIAGDADAVIGSRLLRASRALPGRMPLVKLVGDKLLTTIQNRLLGSRLSDLHSGYRAYAVRSLERVPFASNTNDFHFDSEIVIQLLRSRARVAEIPIPAYSGREIGYLNGCAYAAKALAATVVSRLQEYGVLYRRRFDLETEVTPYRPKLTFRSSHSMAIDAVPPGSEVLDLGCGPGYVGQELRQRKRCRVTGVDFLDGDDTPSHRLDHYLGHDLNSPTLPDDLEGSFDVILLLDVLEHLRAPESLLDEIRRRFGTRQPTLIITTPNIAFLPMRAGLLLGSFNYGKRGILDLTHTRLFTFSTFRRLLEESGLRVEETLAVPAPFPLAFGTGFLGRSLLRINSVLARLLPRLFGYQIFVKGRIVPTVEAFLEEATAASRRLSDQATKKQSAQ